MREETANTLTHLLGVVVTLSTAWIVLRLAFVQGWQHAMGVTIFSVGMLMMFTASTLYHMMGGIKGRRIFRILDHVSIYVMIAASYTPICIGIIGGWLGWTVFGIQWGAVICGIFYKVYALGLYPRLSLALYLIMGWSILFIALPVWQNLSTAPILCLMLEGALYTGGTWFFAHDHRRYYHAVWHIFVLLGALAHWAALLLMLS